MFNSLVGSHMNMKLDIYSLQASQADSGMIKRKWLYSKTIPCRAEVVERLRVGKTINQSPDGFKDELVIKVKTLDPISRRSRITSIRTSDDKIVYLEIDKINPTDTIFEVLQSHAVVDPFGRISYYESLLRRAVVQENDIYSD